MQANKYLLNLFEFLEVSISILILILSVFAFITFFYRILIIFFLIFSVILFIVLFNNIDICYGFFWLILYLLFTSITFYFLITSYCVIPISLTSWVFFSCNLFILIFYFYGFVKIIFDLKNPLHLEDISSFSFYRYHIFLLLCLIVIILYIFTLLVPPRILNLINFTKITFPYLKENLRLIMINSFSEDKLIDFTSKFFELFYKNRSFKRWYIFFNFVIIHALSLLQNCLFFNFVFFHGDLRWNIYLLPFSFFGFIFRFWDYYIIRVLEDNDLFLKDHLHVELKNNNSSLEEKRLQRFLYLDQELIKPF